MNTKLQVKKYKTEGDIAWEYNPLRNLKNKDGEITDFQVDNQYLNIDLKNPIDIEIQNSYDGTVNLILNDDINPPRIINSRMAVNDSNTYKVINRNQIIQTNLYNEDKIDSETRLFRNVQVIPKLNLNKISYYGQLIGGNYIFYLKYSDEDNNETDIVAESGIISIFNGTITDPKTCNGTLMEERTDKSIILSLNDIDTSFTYFNLYYIRYSCDKNGITTKKAYKINHQYEITNNYQLISINGYEDLEEISVEDLNIDYNYVESVKTQAQVQNMLFFANVSKLDTKDADLRNLSYHIIATETQDTNSIGFINPNTFQSNPEDDQSQVEYYSPLNIYYKLGYFPGELYRFGIVYIFNDDSLSPVYNLRGIDFNKVIKNTDNKKINYEFNGEITQIEYSDFLDKSTLSNTGGVFRFSKDINIINYVDKSVNPLSIKFEIPEIVINKLSEFKIKGYFFVRQQRIPVFLAQGFSIGVDSTSFVPTLRNGYKNDEAKYFTESFLNKSKTLVTDYNSRLIDSTNCQSSGLLCVDAYVNKQLQSLFNTSQFKISKAVQFNNDLNSFNTRIYYPEFQSYTDNVEFNMNLLYIEQEVPQKIFNNYGYSTKAGMQEDLKQLICFGEYKQDDADFTNYVRGIYTAFIGCGDKINDNSIWNIYIKNFSETFIEEYFTIRIRDKSPFYTISDRYNLKNDSSINIITFDNIIKTRTESKTTYENINDWYKDLKEYIKLGISNSNEFNNWKNIIDNISNQNLEKAYNDSLNYEENNLNKPTNYIPNKLYLSANIYSIPNIYRGDCFTATVCTRMMRNFTSQSVPINDQIIEPDCWKNYFKGAKSTEDWDAISKADVDAVPIGHWFIYKCLSNYNLGLRSNDSFNTDEIALMGNPRSFYPLSDISTKSSAKIPESNLLNMGYSVTLGDKRNYAFERIPYIKDNFDTRIMFSNIQVDGAFKNSYKIFQGLSYQDFDRQYGSIVKILPWNANLLIVFEHAIALAPVNEKALLQTTEGQSIHLYGSEVLQKQLTLISDIYGSTWKDSIIRTPRGLYGVDTYAKKIWKFNGSNFELISDFKIQSFLNDNINLKELEKSIILGVRNVKTHYNAYKSDIMFTFYNNDKIWNICYNELRNLWITRYSWTPLFSENINNSFFTFDLLKTKIFGIINNNLKNQDQQELYPNNWSGIWEKENNEWQNKELTFNINKYNGYNITSICIKGYSWDRNINKIKETILYQKTANKITGLIDLSDSPNQFTFDIYNIDWSSNLSSNVEKQNELYNKYELIKDNINRITFNKDYIDFNTYMYYIVDIKYIPYVVGSYEGDIDTINEINTNENKFLAINSTEKSYSIGLILSYNSISEEAKISWDKMLLNKIYVHGKAVLADEINYNDLSTENQILPTKWYDSQEPFEFEFIVNDPKGIHKIFDNLVIISNNVEPNSLEVEIIGDAYHFTKENIFKNENFDTNLDYNVVFNKINLNKEKNLYYKTNVIWDNTTNEYSLLIHQDSININTYGRRLGNIYYNEDCWYVTLQPIYYNDVNNKLELSKIKSTKIRDKYAKIRIKYKGDKLVIITALQTLMTQSYA